MSLAGAGRTSPGRSAHDRLGRQAELARRKVANPTSLGSAGMELIADWVLGRCRSIEDLGTRPPPSGGPWPPVEAAVRNRWGLFSVPAARACGSVAGSCQRTDAGGQ